MVASMTTKANWSLNREILNYPDGLEGTVLRAFRWEVHI